MKPPSKKFPNNVQVLGWFGRDSEGEYCDNDAEVVQYLHRPKPNRNLNWDLKLIHPEDEPRQDGITYKHIFEWIMRNNTPSNNEKLRNLDVHFVCKRSVLQEIMKTAPNRDQQNIKKPEKYNNYPLTILAKRLENVIYLYASWSDNDDYNNKSSDKSGSRFEKYLLAKKGETPNPNRAILQYEDMQLVYRAQIYQYGVLYAGEVDGLPLEADLKDLNAKKLVELKTVKIDTDDKHIEERYPGWWSQCVLSNCNEVLLGKPDREGLDKKERVNSLKSITLEQLGKKVDPVKVTLRVKAALDVISGEMETADDLQVRMFHFRSSCNTVYLVKKEGSPPADDEDEIIPANYEASLNKLTLDQNVVSGGVVEKSRRGRARK